MAVDPYRWAQEAGLYIEQDELVALQDAEQRGGNSLLVLDVRDEDCGGGSIAGAIHQPDGTFDVEAVAQLAAGKRTVVLHCMESARRAPRCARRLHEHWAAEDAAGAPAPAPARPRICVLQGGADQWVRRFWRDESRVSGFDHDYWGFGGADDSPAHRDYVRPVDQPATPWSGAGSAGSEVGCAAGSASGGEPTYFREHCRPLSDEDLARARRERLGELDDRSVGCVAFSLSGGVLSALMIKQRMRSPGQSYWCFPKGHAEPGEDDVAAARRETLEETGLEPSRIEAEVFVDVGYSVILRLHKDRWRQHEAFPDESRRPILCTHKTVRYQLAVADGTPPPEAQTEEAEAVRWVPCAEVYALLSHDEERGAFRTLAAHPAAQALCEA